MVLYISHIYKKPPPPKDVDEDEEEDEEVGWIFLFVDLVYVALLSKLSHVIEYCALSVHTFLFVITIFTVSFVTRLTIDDYACRFVTNDIVHRLAYFVYTMTNFIMTLNANAHHTDYPSDKACKANFYTFGFSCGFLISRLVFMALLCAVIYEDQKAERQHNLDLKGPSYIPVAEQIELMFNDLRTNVSVFKFFFGAPVPSQRKRFNSAFKQFSGTIFKLFCSSFIVIVLLCLQYNSSSGGAGATVFPPAYKVYMYVLAMTVEVGGHFFHYFVFESGKKKVGGPSKKKSEKESEGSAKWNMLNDEARESITQSVKNALEIELSKQRTGTGGRPVSLSLKHRSLSSCSRTPESGGGGVSGMSEGAAIAHKEEEEEPDEYYQLRIVQYQERLGAFMMMVMGEAVIVLLLPYYDTKTAKSSYFFSVCACWLLFLYGVQYYDAQNFKEESAHQNDDDDGADTGHDTGGEDTRRKIEDGQGHGHDHDHGDDDKPKNTHPVHHTQHAMNHSALSRFLYIWLHLVLAVCVFFTAASMGGLYLEAMKVYSVGYEADDNAGAGDDDDGDDAGTGTGSSSSGGHLNLSLRQLRGVDYTASSGEGGGTYHSRVLGGGGGSSSSGDSTNDDVVDTAWDHRSLASLPVLLSSSVALFIVFVTVIRALHSGLEKLTLFKQTGSGDRAMGRAWSKLFKLGWALLHLTVGWWELGTQARYVGVHCGLLTALTVWEVYLRFRKDGLHVTKKEDKDKDKCSKKAKKETELMKVTVRGYDGGRGQRLTVQIKARGRSELVTFESYECSNGDEGGQGVGVNSAWNPMNSNLTTTGVVGPGAGAGAGRNSSSDAFEKDHSRDSLHGTRVAGMALGSALLPPGVGGSSGVDMDRDRRRLSSVAGDGDGSSPVSHSSD